jgi:hypothetical protein
MKRKSTYISFSKIEFRRALKLRNGGAALLFIFLAMSLIQDGVHQYLDHMKQKEEFKKIEFEKAKQHLKYEVYGSIGMMVYFAPAPLEIFFNKSAAAPQMTAGLNAGEKLSIDTSMNGGDMFKNRGGNFADFGGLMMLVGYLMVIFYGTGIFRHKRYRQMLANIMGNNRVFWQAVLCRFQVIGFFFLAVTAAAVGLVLLNGIVLSGQDYINLAVFFLEWLLTGFFMFIIGSLLGKLPSRETGNLLAIIIWIVAVLVLPAAADKAVEKKSDAIISHFQAELDKWNKIIAFENRANQEAGEFDPANTKTKTERDLVESFIAKEYQGILAAEKQLEVEIAENVKFYRDISTVFPTTSHRAVTNRLSGKGYDAGRGFYRFSRITKERFADFYKKKRYYSNDKQVEPFIKGEEGVYYGESKLPGNFLWMVLVKLGWVLAVLVAAYLVNRSDLYGYRLNTEAKNLPRLLSFGRGKRQVIRTYGDGMGDYLYRVLSRKGRGAGILWEGRDLVESPQALGFVYICAPGDIPGDIPVRDFLALQGAVKGRPREEYPGLLEGLKPGVKAGRYGRLPLMKQFEVLMSLAEGASGDIYIFRNTALEMPARAYIRIKERMEELAGAGAAVIYLTANPLAVDREAETPRDYGQIKLEAWDHMVEGLKRYRERREKKEKQGDPAAVENADEDSEEIDILDEILSREPARG